MASLQFALALALTYSAAVLALGFVRVRSHPLGYDANHVLALRLQTYSAGPWDLAARQRVREFYSSVMEYARGMPGVESVTAALPRPTVRDFLWDLRFDGGHQGPQAAQSEVRFVAPSYFATMRTLIVRGRDFDPGESVSSRRTIVNEAFVNAYFPKQDPIGRRIGGAFFDPGVSYEIIGVAADSVDDVLHGSTRPCMYVPGYNTAMDLLVRAETDALPLQALGKYIRKINPATTMETQDKLDHEVSGAISTPRLEAVLSSIFAASALLLAIAGLYGSVRYTAEMRRAEIAIRAALGATPAQLMGHALRRTFLTVGLGVAGGDTLVLALKPVLAHLLVDSLRLDLSTLLITNAILSAAAVIIGQLGFRMAARLHPAQLLRLG